MSFHHVALEIRARDADAEVAFWGLLGFAEFPVPAGLRLPARWVRAGNAEVHLIFSDAPVVPADGHAAVVCIDYEATVTALRAAGHDAAPRTEYWGSPRTIVTSPTGHRVELMKSGH